VAYGIAQTARCQAGASLPRSCSVCKSPRQEDRTHRDGCIDIVVGAYTWNSGCRAVLQQNAALHLRGRIVRYRRGPKANSGERRITNKISMAFQYATICVEMIEEQRCDAELISIFRGKVA
jgi:hypothetical protein